MVKATIYAGDPYWDAHHVLHRSVAAGLGLDFGLEDIAPKLGWGLLVAAGVGDIVVGGALSGAVDGLRDRGVTRENVLECRVVRSGGAATLEDMHQARSWLSAGFAAGRDQDAEQKMVTEALVTVGDHSNLLRITSLVLAIAVVAGYAAIPAETEW